LISSLRAVDEHDLTNISSEFESAAADRRVQLIEMGVAA
jgi:hypothetical protein